jgi:DNA-binding MarR family transcriptional regulator
MSTEDGASTPLACQADPEFVKAVRLLAWITKSFESACPQSGISLAKYRVLLLVSADPLRATELASRARVSLATLSGLVNSLEEQGLLERTALRSDRRGVALRLTRPASKRAQGREILARQLLAIVENDGDEPARGAVGALERPRSFDRARPGEQPDRLQRTDRRSCSHRSIRKISWIGRPDLPVRPLPGRHAKKTCSPSASRFPPTSSPGWSAPIETAFKPSATASRPLASDLLLAQVHLRLPVEIAVSRRQAEFAERGAQLLDASTGAITCASPPAGHPPSGSPLPDALGHQARALRRARHRRRAASACAPPLSWIAGIIRHLRERSLGRDPAEVLRVLDALQTASCARQLEEGRGHLNAA